MSNLNRTSRKTSEIVDIVVMKGSNLVARGDFWPNGAGLSIDIEDEDLRSQVESGVRFLLNEPAAISANLLCGWEVAILKRRAA